MTFLVAEGDRTQPHEAAARVAHVVNVFLEASRGDDRAQLAVGIDHHREVVAGRCMTPRTPPAKNRVWSGSDANRAVVPRAPGSRCRYCCFPLSEHRSLRRTRSRCCLRPLRCRQRLVTDSRVEDAAPGCRASAPAPRPPCCNEPSGWLPQRELSRRRVEPPVPLTGSVLTPDPMLLACPVPLVAARLRPPS